MIVFVDRSKTLPFATEFMALGLLAAAVRLLRQRGVSPARIHFEHFDFR